MTSVTLSYPIQRDGQTVSAVTVRRPTGATMIQIGDHLPTLMALSDGEATNMNAATFKAMVAVAGSLSGLDEDAASLDFEDLQRVVEAGLATLGNAPPSGPAPTG